METVLLAGLLGLIFGSFATSLTWRLPQNISPWRGRSVCPHCRQTLAIRDLVPVLSWVLSGRRCRHCSQPVSWRYLGIELAMAVLFVVAISLFGWTLTGVISLVAIFALVVIFVIDWQHGIIPDVISLPAVGLIGLLQLFNGMPWQHLVVAILIGAGVFGLQYALSAGRWVGGGDIRLGALMGVILGWPAILEALFLAYLLGAMVAVTLLLIGRKQVGTAMPFGPALVVATLWTLFSNHLILDWYLQLL